MFEGKTGPLPPLKDFEKFLKDVKSTNYHYELIERALEVAKSIDEVEGVLLKGSLGKGEGDIFSDIDFQILHNDEPEDSDLIKSKFMKHLSEVGNVIQFFPSTAFAEDSIIYFHPFVKFELSVGTCRGATCKWRIGAAKILFDRNGLVHNTVEQSKTIPLEFDTVLPIIQGRAIALPVFTYITAGFVVRGEYIAAVEAVDWIAEEMLRISGWLVGIRDEGPRRAEKRFPKEVLSYFHSTRVKDTPEVWNSLEVILDWYEKWMIEKLDEHNIPHSAHQVPRMRQVLKLLKSKTSVK